MESSFHKIQIDDFPGLLAQVTLTRTIRSVHLHHTFRPSQRQFQGEPTLDALRRIHRDKGWIDIAQHLTIDPEGGVWTGRSWNLPPASAAGNNGNLEAGPLMVSVVGDFSPGCDRLNGKQRSALVDVLGRLLARFNFPKEFIHLHRNLSPAILCPGTGVEWNRVVDEAAEVKTKIMRGAGSPAREAELPEFDNKYRANRRIIDEILESITVKSARRSDPPDAEPADERMSPEEVLLYSGPSIHVEHAPKTARGGGDANGELNLTPETRQLLRQHVVNLKQGMLSAGGLFETSKDDVRTIFSEHLPESLERAKAEGRKLRIVFYAHGGLTDEARGLKMAALQIPWWLSNGIYPIHFVWETGFLETITQLVRGSREVQREAQRAITDFSDRLIESVARRLGGLTLWSGMKRSAERANAPGGGAHLVAKKLVTFLAADTNNIEVHAVGHSAGSIFHAEFINRACELNVPFTSVHFLAPAIRVDRFKKRLLHLMGKNKGIGHTRIYTMAKDWELNDNVAQVYRKSLLYLIYYGLEPERETAILGLDESLHGDADLRKAFGLGGNPIKEGEVIFSKTHAADGNRASTSTTHGCFDNDAPTMNSVARWILQNPSVHPLPDSLSRECAQAQREIIERATPLGPASFGGIGGPAQPNVVAAAPSFGAGGFVAPAGNRRALCIGINEYPTAPLYGCVADAESWHGALIALGFSASMLRNGEATRDAILDNFSHMVDGSRPGDTVVLQYAGHGTQLPDASGDEIGQDSVQDEALCPFDFASGAFVIDDDIAEIFRRIPDGVNVTCFFDCCHSGTISRFAVGTAQTPQSGERPRFMRATPEMRAAHADFRRRAGARAAGPRAPETMREVVFSACLSSEVAWESGGQGDFTVRALEILHGGIQNLTNEEFQRRVVSAFGLTPRQRPYLDCAAALRQLPLLGYSAADANRGTRAHAGATPDLTAVARILRAAAAALESPA